MHDVGDLVKPRDPRKQELTISAAVCGDVEMENVHFPADRSDPELRERKGEDESSSKNPAVSSGGQPGELNIEIRTGLEPFRDEVCDSVHSALAAEYGHAHAERLLRLLHDRPDAFGFQFKRHIELRVGLERLEPDEITNQNGIPIMKLGSDTNVLRDSAQYPAVNALCGRGTLSEKPEDHGTGVDVPHENGECG